MGQNVKRTVLPMSTACKSRYKRQPREGADNDYYDLFIELCQLSIFTL